MRTLVIAILSLGAAALASTALPQSSSVSAGPDGSVSATVRTPGSPSVSVQAGNGKVKVSPPPRRPNQAHPVEDEADEDVGESYAGPGRSVTVRSADGSAYSSATVTGSNAAVAGAGSPGSKVTVSPAHRRTGAAASTAKKPTHIPTSPSGTRR